MPRKTKDAEKIEKEEKKAKISSNKKTTKKASVSKKTTAVKKVTASKKSTSKSTSKVSPETKKVTKKTTAVAKKVTKKATSKKSSTVKKVASSTAKVKKNIKNDLEYYDLPYSYNDTIVKILAQTPKTLFIYWNVSDSDREKLSQRFGDNFFNDTYPVLIVTNETKKYTFETPINDFANSWYLDINDEKCKYHIELGRRFKVIQNSTDYIPITSSNNIEVPNNHILLDKIQKQVFFKNVITEEITNKDFSNFYYMKKIGKIHDLYKQLYNNENLDNYLDNPSSNNPTSTFK